MIEVGSGGINRKVLVTGATGFVGDSLIRYLAQSSGFEVRAACRKRIESPAQNIFCMAGCDLSNDDHWPDALAGMGSVVHCAALTSSAGVAEELVYRINVEGTLRVARLAAEAGVSRFVFISSLKVNGESTSGRGPFNESSVPSPEDPYARSKWDAEQGLMEIARSTDMDVIIVRCPLIYGYGVKGNFEILMRLAASGWPLPFGGIENARSFLFIDNLCDFLATVLAVDFASSQLFLLSDGYDPSSSELIRLMRAALGRRAGLFRFPWRWVRPLVCLAQKEAMIERLTGSLQLDSSKAQEVLGWKAPIEFEEGIRKTMASSGAIQS
ncbi:NAD-dependent epimerase/dehydratase family protein [Marinobacter sp. JSM 1782161]|uniref:NAD-dependent epimerase/dehydratase family protein n=1 Tax=Marinobacter sp. JSM 1782161 TaxID=2685906 RepID=UPI0014031408|nr:NAD-dependent epimerase/dehydratase family protein [Marinobacter sp. JSM 1782161]